MEVVSVPVIAAIVYGIMTVYKNLFTAEKWRRLIPLWSAVLGVILGVVAYYVAPEIIVADNILTAIEIGLFSGLGATGINQIYKQATK